MPIDDARPVSSPAGRRRFLTRAMCAGGMLCLGCSRAFAGPRQAPSARAGQGDTFSADSKMSFKQVYAFAYTRNMIPVLKELRRDIGREKLLPMLQGAASRAAVENISKTAPKPPNNTLAAYAPDMADYFWSHVLTMDWIERTDVTVEIRVTRCLWAETFRGADAADIGYATICHPDFAATTAYNPKIRMTRTRTLMQGFDCCNHRWVLEA